MRLRVVVEINHLGGEKKKTLASICSLVDRKKKLKQSPGQLSSWPTETTGSFPCGTEQQFSRESRAGFRRCWAARGWRDFSEVRAGPGLPEDPGSVLYNQHGWFSVPVTPSEGAPTPSSGLLSTCIHVH